jgi:hypothetical protein
MVETWVEAHEQELLEQWQRAKNHQSVLKERFRLVEGDYSLIWLDPETGIYDEKAVDIAPECIRFFCEKYGKKLKAAEKPLAERNSINADVQVIDK